MNPNPTAVVQQATPPLLSISQSQVRSPFFRRSVQPYLPLDFLSFSPSLFKPAAVSSSSVPSPIVDIEMVRGRDGSWSARDQNVVVLWDLDSKPPRSKPYDAALALRRVAEIFGRVVEISAYSMERRELVIHGEHPYICGICGRKCRTNHQLQRHFLQLHERERQKKISRMRSLKGKKRQKYVEKHISGNNQRYTEAARRLLTPKEEHGLASELRRAGICIKTVGNKSQAAVSVVRRRMQNSTSQRIDCLFLVSDDLGFSEVVKGAREADLRTVVVGDGRRALGRLADFWVSWNQVEKGQVGEEVLLSGRNNDFQEGGEEAEEEEGLFNPSVFYDDDEDDSYSEDDEDDDYSDDDYSDDETLAEILDWAIEDEDEDDYYI